jgi:uncharacterized protein
MIKRQTSLSANIVQFCRYLRSHGYAISPEEEALALRAMAEIDLGMQSEFKDTLQAVLCRSVQQIEQFSSLFHKYWKELDKATDSKIKDVAQQKNKQQAQKASFDSLKAWLNGNRQTEETTTASYSLEEVLTRKDFSTVLADELDELLHCIQEVSHTVANRIHRRYQKTHQNRMFDLRQTLRKNMRRGGELVELAHRKPRKNRLKIVILADVSQSMDLYSKFLIQFLYAFQRVYRNIETFVFSTDLFRITQDLRSRNFQDAMKLLSESHAGWSGGTQIGQCLSSFSEQYIRLVDKQTVVIIMSDGWDTGDTNLIAENMEKIHLKARKTIWLNPLAGNANFEPKVQGMQAALPYIDTFASVHNVESLRKLGKWL